MDKYRDRIVGVSMLLLVLSISLFFLLGIPLLDCIFDFVMNHGIVPWNGFTGFLFANQDLIHFFLVVIWMIVTIYSVRIFYLKQIINIYQVLNDEAEIPTLFSLKESLNSKLEGKRVIRELLLVKEKYAKEKLHESDVIIYLAHDLKTPLTSVIGYFFLLKDKQIQRADDKTYYPIINEKLKRLEKLRLDLEQMLSMEEKPKLHYVTCDVVKLVSSLAKDMRFVNAHQAIVITGLQSIRLEADETMLQRLFGNLLQNAMRYGKPNCDLSIHFAVDNEMASIQISNETDDLKQEDLKHLFEKFYRKDESRSTHSGGAGLGLAIAKQIALQHKGVLQATLHEGLLCMEVQLVRDGGSRNVSTL